MDVGLSLVGLLPALPVTLLCAVAIMADSKGAPLLAQERVGRNGRLFRCYKLRTMHSGTPQVATHQASAGSVTRVGKVLRRTKLDELPQLWNVLRGEMSLVGPRPCLPVQTALIEARRALGVTALRPGITGVAQVQGIDMSDPERLAAVDATYLGQATVWRDLRLIFQTLAPLRSS